MTNTLTGEGVNNGAPIDVLPDVLIHQQSIMDRPSDAYYAMANMVHERARLIEETGEVSPELIEDTVFCVAFRDALLSSELFDEHRVNFESGREAKMTARYDEKLQPHGVTMTEIKERAQQLSIADVYEYFQAKLETYTVFLATGNKPTNWPEAMGSNGLNLLRSDTSGNVRTIAETLYASIGLFIDELGGAINCQSTVQRYQDWLQQACGLMLSKRRVGLAAPLINTVRRIDEGQVLLDKLTLAMAEVQSEEGEESYRRLYGFIASTLREPYLSDFLRANQKQEAPLTFGATRKIERIGKTAILTERFEEGELVHARLADGSGIVLPYRYFRERGVFNYQEPNEYEMYGSQSSVSYDELEDPAKEAIETAWRAEELERLKEETLPYYKRLALKPDKIMGDRLHTVAFRDGYGRRGHRYPDDHGMVSSDTEPHIDNPVISARRVSDSWLVIPYDDNYVSWSAYIDAEPNFFGPGEDKANAFWVAGNPRMVFDKSGNPKYMNPDPHDGRYDRARWVLMPVRYYWVEEQKPEPNYDDDLDFLKPSW